MTKWLSVNKVKLNPDPKEVMLFEKAECLAVVDLPNFDGFKAVFLHRLCNRLGVLWTIPC